MNCTPYPLGIIRPFGPGGWGLPFSWLVTLSLVVFWIWTMVEILTKETDEKGQRVLWAVIVGLTYVIGAVIYHIVRRPERIKTLGH